MSPWWLRLYCTCTDFILSPFPRRCSISNYLCAIYVILDIVSNYRWFEVHRRQVIWKYYTILHEGLQHPWNLDLWGSWKKFFNDYLLFPERKNKATMTHPNKAESQVCIDKASLWKFKCLQAKTSRSLEKGTITQSSERQQLWSRIAGYEKN
jgi:hypothetical protein